MIGAYRITARIIDTLVQLGIGAQCARLHLAMQHMQRPQHFLRIGDGDIKPCIIAQGASVAHLPAAFAIKGRLVQQQSHMRAFFGFFNGGAVLQNGEHLPFGLRGLIADKLGCAEFVLHIKPNAIGCRRPRARPIGARIGALLCHCRFKASGVNRIAFFAQGVLCQV